MATYDFDTLLKILPELAYRIWVDEVSGAAELQQAITAAGLDEKIEFFEGGPRVYHRVTVEELEDEEAAEKKLRSAISRKVGKPGNSKQWDIGSFMLGARLHRSAMNIDFSAQYSLAEVRRAAVDWFDGMDGKEWLVKHYFVESADAEPNERGFLTRPERVTQSPYSKLSEDGKVSTKFTLGAGAKPPGVKAKSESEAYENLVHYLREVLGDPDPASSRFPPPVWTKGESHA
ncbi:hypothetical protein [Leucobacter denitrificans]|uniref:Uncharacterized protein n=1 Tax=Leucobacter denitrificans TaxID=683042 RepID=A0A7G9S2F5_9MICO|nr:hypothetical protein [Leucobacter denitrificans]QNN62030.1 hypothetical protein H9L06_06820 [Leucobacter denitrificans]